MSTSIICEPEAVWRQVATHKPLWDKKICSSGQNFENQKLGKFEFKILQSDERDYHHWKGKDFQFTNHSFFFSYLFFANFGLFTAPAQATEWA